MVEVKEKTYSYVNSYPGGVVYRPQRELTQEGNIILNNAMIELFESLSEEKKEMIYKKHTKEAV